jgi:REP element-mobilizing transposase RayT
MPQSFACLHYHLVFSTKNREPFLSAGLRPRLFEYFGGILRAHGGCLVAAGGIEDHVHLLAGLSREMAVAEALRLLKANSSKWVHETGAGPAAFAANSSKWVHETGAGPAAFAWQTGYAAFTVSLSKMGAVKRYLARQEEHHRTQTFQDEYRALLRRHRIAFDERYLWD